jgi:hypothetical protein
MSGFRRILKYDSDIADLRSCLVDVSRFEAVSVQGSYDCSQMLSEIYPRQEDGYLMVVKLRSLSDSVNNRKVETAIEKEVNLLNSCITSLIDFIFRTDSSGFRELRIVEGA